MTTIIWGILVSITLVSGAVSNNTDMVLSGIGFAIMWLGVLFKEKA